MNGAEELNRRYIDAVTRELRDAGWYPQGDYLCGCNPTHLCQSHRTQRAVDHYHPETIR